MPVKRGTPAYHRKLEANRIYKQRKLANRTTEQELADLEAQRERMRLHRAGLTEEEKDLRREADRKRKCKSRKEETKQQSENRKRKDRDRKRREWSQIYFLRTQREDHKMRLEKVENRFIEQRSELEKKIRMNDQFLQPAFGEVAQWEAMDGCNFEWKEEESRQEEIRQESDRLRWQLVKCAEQATDEREAEIQRYNDYYEMLEAEDISFWREQVSAWSKEHRPNWDKIEQQRENRFKKWKNGVKDVLKRSLITHTGIISGMLKPSIAKITCAICKREHHSTMNLNGKLAGLKVLGRPIQSSCSLLQVFGE